MNSTVEKILVENGQHIVGHLFTPEKLRAKYGAILFIHGWASSQRRNKERAQELAHLGYVCLTIDLRGHGESEGEFEKLTRADHLADTVVAYDFLLSQRDVDPENISVIGASYGGYLAVLLAAERLVKNLVLRVPANYYDDGFDSPTHEIRKAPGLPSYRETDLTPQKNKALHAASLFTGNAYIIESENDEIIPHQTIENYKNAFQKVSSLKYALMQGATHGLKGEAIQEYSKLLRDYFSEQP
jgi:pimeloyl-ACP methyl ester carboxylesterase